MLLRVGLEDVLLPVGKRAEVRLTPRRPNVAVQTAEHGRLAAAALADNPDRPTGPQLEVDICTRDHGAARRAGIRLQVRSGELQAVRAAGAVQLRQSVDAQRHAHAGTSRGASNPSSESHQSVSEHVYTV